MRTVWSLLTYHAKLIKAVSLRYDLLESFNPIMKKILYKVRINIFC